MSKNALTYILLFSIFLLSVLVRLPTLNRPLSKHHEFCTAIALRILKSWEQHGIKQLHFKPATNFSGNENKFINNYASGSNKIIDSKGNYYYLSHPPLAYYMAYGFLKIFHLPVNVLSLQIFNLLLHFLCGMGVFFIVKTLQPLPVTSFHIPAVVAFVVYIFSPTTLWFQSNVYMSDMAVQLPFVFAVLIVAKMLMYEHHLFKNALLFFIACFCMVYTSWLGIFFCITSLILIFRGKLFFSLTIIEILFSAIVLGLGITFLQYAKIAGIENFKAEMLCRFNDRSSFQGWYNFLYGFISVLKNYIFNYAALYAILLIAIAGTLWVRKRIKINATYATILLVATLPIVMLHLVLLNYSGHDFTVLYAALPLSLFMGLLAMRVYQHISRWYVFSFLLIFVVLNVAQYYFINCPGDISQSGERYDIYLKEGNYIQQHAAEQAVVFALQYKPTPETIWYAQRNIKQVDTKEEAILFLKQRNILNGVIFYKDDKGILSYFDIKNTSVHDKDI